ncbi:hypothetical protein E2C01_013778 [Portunus trituberculatus]|uniref:Uncharacterized protein n=1 Tax=Portunus trituberculatus TaxID=210409 RepID=A0A5B7DI17_PORTR|nr:hypothetical protein [Portunus trituberculatus]
MQSYLELLLLMNRLTLEKIPPFLAASRAVLVKSPSVCFPMNDRSSNVDLLACKQTETEVSRCGKRCGCHSLKNCCRQVYSTTALYRLTLGRPKYIHRSSSALYNYPVMDIQISAVPLTRYGSVTCGNQWPFTQD